MIDIERKPNRAIKYFNNPRKNKGVYPNDLKGILNLNDSLQAFDEISQWQDYQKTPLHLLKGIAQELNIAGLYYKDEGPRLGLGSFKALGGAYGVLKFLQKTLSEQTGDNISLQDVRLGKYRHLTSEITVITATDGNHGRSVAWGAKLFGCLCRIYIHTEVSKGRQEAMEELGASVIRIEGNYDESVHLAAFDAQENGWFIVSDTSYEGYTEIPKYIMAGYTVLMEEIVSQLNENILPSHVFLQGGVGGLASAASAFLWEKYGSKCPKIIVVEPDRAPCLMASAMAGKPTVVEVKEETIMAGLSCGEVSMLSWKILEQSTDSFLSIPDDTIPDMMRRLAAGEKGDSKIVAGESAVAGLAALMTAYNNQAVFKALGLGPDSRVLLIGTEGATDPEIYNSIINS